MKKMLLVMAHPDDESFATGGTVAKYVGVGWRADLVCATRGEAGTSGPYEGVTGDALGEIRQKELEKAGVILGLSSVTFLGYRDGTLSDEHAGELEDKIFQYMIKEIPDCILTYDTTGISNHPDHIKVCYATTYAFQKYAFWVSDKLSGNPEYSESRDPKLYYACMPASIAKHLVEKKVVPSLSFDKPWHGTPDKFITTVIDTGKFAAVKKKALLAHKTQSDDVNRFLSYSGNPLLYQEYFILRMHGVKEVFMGKGDRVADRL
jgi:LmbE family N-acetylglucosaminyl deacetylase